MEYDGPASFEGDTDGWGWPTRGAEPTKRNSKNQTSTFSGCLKVSVWG